MSQNTNVVRYFLRPNPTAYDLRINRNRYGLKRRTMKRSKESRTSNRITSQSKPKIHHEIIRNITEKARNECYHPVTENKVTSVHSKGSNWTLPQPTLEIYSRKIVPKYYDATKEAHFLKLNEECLFEIFNQLSLNELCIMAEVCPELKFAAQKYFDVIYTALNLDWLVDCETGKFTLVQAERLLKNFGHLISTVFVNTNLLELDHSHSIDYKEKFLLLIEKYCSGFVFLNTK